MKKLFTLVLILFAINSYSQQKAFPSAYGAGAYITGGRGGTVYHVTNLNNSGTGSLRDALSQDDRTIVFDVSGVIYLSSSLSINNRSNVTIAGQTAPEGGITIDGDRVYFENFQNVIVRYIRFKGGIQSTAYNGGATNSFQSKGNIINQIFDHCTFAFGFFQGGSWYVEDDSTVDSLTVQRCFFANNDRGVLAGGGTGTNVITGEYSFISNLFYNQRHRTPNISGDGGRADVINNVVWNVQNRLIQLKGSVTLNHIGNYYDYNNNAVSDNRMQMFSTSDENLPVIYTDDNKYVAINTSTPLTSSIAEINADNTLAWKYFWEPYTGDQLPSNHFTATQDTLNGEPFTILSPDSAFADVKNNVGCNARLNADGSVSGNLDVLDTEWLDSIKNDIYTVGALPYPPDTTDGWIVPAISSVTRPSGYDTDNDGMADTWETNTFGNLTKDGTGDDDSDGYTDLEEFLNLVDNPVDSIPLVGVTVTPSSDTITVGDTLQLTTTFDPTDATDTTGVWSSSNDSISTVSSSGLVTGIAEGSATITFTSNYGSFTDTCVVTITAVAVASMADFGSIVSGYIAKDLTETVQGDSILTWEDSFGSNDGTSTDSTKTTLNFDNGYKEVLFNGAMFDLGTASDLNFIPTEDPWSCVFYVGSALDSSVLNIIFAIGSGAVSSRQYTIYGHYNGGGKMRASYGGEYATSSILVRPDDVIAVVYDPNISTNGTVTMYKNGSQGYSSELPDLPSVDDEPYNPFIGGRSNGSSFDGSLKGVYVYDEALDSTAVSNIQAFLTSTPPPVISLVGVTVTPSSGTITVGDTQQLATTFDPTDATDTTGVWSSSNGSFATVSSSGLVTGIAEGTATITFTSNYGSFTDTCVITVSGIPLVGVTVTPSSDTITVGDTLQLTTTFDPTDATDTTGVWSSSNDSISTVSSSGLVTGIAEGSATITFTSNYGSFTDTCVVTITAVAVASMADFGSIVSGYIAKDLTETVQGDSILTWEDSFGSNDGTSTDSTKTTLNFDNGYKEVLFNGAMFDLGTASDLNFIPTEDPWSCVFYVGSALDSSVLNIIFAIGSGAVSSRQYTIYGHYNGGGKMRASYGGEYATSSILVRPDDVIAVVYDPNISTNGTVTMYKNGSQGYSSELPDLPSVDDEPYNPFIGGRSNGSSFDGSLKGVYVYDEALDSTAVSNIQAFLTSESSARISSSKNVSTFTEEEEEFSVFPNPATSELNIRTSGIENHFISIYNSLGQEVFFSKKNISSYNIDINSWESGLYMIILRDMNLNLKGKQKLIVK